MHAPLFPSLCLATLTLASTAAQADWIVPPASNVHLGGGTIRMGCASLRNSGTVDLGHGTLLAAGDVELTANAQLAIGSGQVQLARQWINQGSATATTGSVVRQSTTGCPADGPEGPLALSPPPASTPVTVPPIGGSGSGGTAQVAIGTTNGSGATVALPPGCTLTHLGIDHVIPPDAPNQAQFPLGVLRFEATGCPGATLQVSITYPPGSLAGLVPQKYGPHGNPPQTGWFTPPGLVVSGDTVRYSVTDGGDGDGDARPGVIVDPFAPMWLGAAAPGDAQAIPTLGEWGLLLLSTLAALLGAVRLRRPARRPSL